MCHRLKGVERWRGKGSGIFPNQEYGGWGLSFGWMACRKFTQADSFREGKSAADVTSLRKRWGGEGGGVLCRTLAETPGLQTPRKSPLGYLPSFVRSGETWPELPEERCPQNKRGYQRETLNGYGQNTGNIVSDRIAVIGLTLYRPFQENWASL